jgi:hypothetical protein
VVVTLGGIMFESGQLDSASYAKSRDAVTTALMIVIILSIIYYFTVLFTELHMMITEDARRKRLEQQKAVRSGKDGPAPKVDIELGDVQMQNNQFVSSASDKKGDEANSMEMDAILALEDMDSYTWIQVKSKLRDMQMRFKELQEQQRESKVAALSGDGAVGSSAAIVTSRAAAAPGSPAINPMMALAQTRRNFAPARVGAGGSGGGGSSPAGASRRGLLRKGSDVGGKAATEEAASPK